MKRFVRAGLSFLFASSAIATAAFAQPVEKQKGPTPIIAVTRAAPRPIVIIGGWSNCPKDFDRTALVRALQADRGANRVILTTHADAWGDVDTNAQAEGTEIATRLAAIGVAPGGTFDLVGFSMGGLVARAIVLHKSASLGGYRVRNLVTIATPNHGANPVLTNVDPGVSFSFTSNECFPGRSGVTYHSTVAARQMAPGSAFLSELNAQKLPADIRVSTIAGEIQADVPEAGVQQITRVSDALCNANCAGGNPPAPVPSGGNIRVQFPPRVGPTVDASLSYVDQWHGACEAKINGNALCRNDTTCLPGQQRFSDNGVWKCTTTVPAPQVTTQRIPLGNDGFIRVNSVRLQPNEAATLGEQAVFTGVYHTQGTENSVRRDPNPKPLIDARDAAPTGTGRVVVGTAVDGTWFFEDDRAIAALRRMTAL